MDPSPSAHRPAGPAGLRPSPGTVPGRRVAVLEGVGGYVPPRVVTNADLSTRLDTSDTWIRERLGIEERRVADGEATVDLATEAGGRALEMAGGGAIDAVLLATSTPDRLCPASAPEVAARLGYVGVTAFDIGAVCAGFIHALAVAGALIAAETARRVLVIGADVFTSLVDPADRLSSAIFGDGAGAVVLRAGRPDEPGAVGPFDLGSDGRPGAVSAVEVPAGGSRTRKGLPTASDQAYLVMDGPAVFERAVAEMSRSCAEVLRSAGWEPGDVDRFVPHQANIRIIRAVAASLGLPEDRCPTNIHAVGNTVAASVPLALGDAHDAGRLEPGHRMLLTSIGAGLAWGSAVLTWPELEGKSRI